MKAIILGLAVLLTSSIALAEDNQFCEPNHDDAKLILVQYNEVSHIIKCVYANETGERTSIVISNARINTEDKHWFAIKKDERMCLTDQVGECAFMSGNMP